MLRKLTSPPVARTAAGRLLRQGCCVVRASRARSSAASGTILKGQCHTAPPTESTWLGVGSGSGLGLGVGLGLGLATMPTGEYLHARGVWCVACGMWRVHVHVHIAMRVACCNVRGVSVACAWRARGVCVACAWRARGVWRVACACEEAALGCSSAPTACLRAILMRRLLRTACTL